MATCNFLKDLTTGNNNACIKVRVTREWKVKNSTDEKKVTAKYYILMDEEGTQIQAKVQENSQIPSYEKRLKLGDVYMISKYNVGPAYATYRTVPGEQLIKLHMETQTRKLSDISSAIPMYKFQMTDFEKARTKTGETKNLMDVVGKLMKVTEDMQTTKGGKNYIDIIIANERDDKMTITLWESQARAFLQCKSEYKKPNVFVIVTSTSAKKMSGDIVLWSSHSTQYFFNLDHPDVVELTKNYKMGEDIIPEVVPFIKTQQQATTQNIERVTIAQLRTAELPTGAKTVSFTSEATVTGINLEKGWSYTGCNKCYKTMPPSNTCTRCTERTSPIPLFRVKVEVKDSTSSTTFVLFEKYVRKLINVSAEHIFNNDENASQDVIPPVLNNILGRTYVFKLILDENNTNEKYEGYTVTDVLEEITKEGPMATTHETVHQSQVVNQDNTEQLKDDEAHKKRKRPTEEENSATLDATEKPDTDLEETDGNNNHTESRHPTPPVVPHSTTKADNDDEHHHKRQK